MLYDATESLNTKSTIWINFVCINYKTILSFDNVTRSKVQSTKKEIANFDHTTIEMTLLKSELSYEIHCNYS